MVKKTDIDDLVSQGWAVVPVRAGEKRPYHGDWTSRTFTSEDFRDGDNVGVKCGRPSNERVDVDLDCEEAVRLAPVVLPTTLSHGHSGSITHYWFQVVGMKNSVKFEAPDGTMLCEIRGDRHQTVAPPSTHPSGATIEWQPNPILKMGAEELQKLVGVLAGVALLSRHWPNKGGRHEISGPLGGVLAKQGIAPAHVRDVVHMLAMMAGDDDPQDRARFAYESAKKFLEQTQHVTGLPTMAKYLSDDVMKKLKEFFDLGKAEQETAVVEDLNTKLAFIRMGGGSAAVAELDEQGHLYMLMNQAAFQSWSSNMTYFVDGKKKNKARLWMEHPNRRTYDGITFAPPPRRDDPKILNTWTGFACQPSADTSGAGCRNYIDHVLRVIADGDSEIFEYIMDYLAATVQKPGYPIGKSIVMRGRQGTGKSVFVESFGRTLFGRHFVAVSNREHISGKFNAHLSGKVVVFADEAIWAGSKSDVGALKRLITQDELTVERKGLDITSEPNCVHLFIASNEPWVINAGQHERRLLVLDVNVKESPEYYTRLFEEVREPGFGPALLAYLQARDVDWTRLAQGVHTAALEEQQDFSASSVQEWWKDKLEEGTIGMFLNWPRFVYARTLWDDYLDCNRYTRDLKSKGRMLKELRSFIGVDAFKNGREPKGHVGRGVALPTLDECRKMFEKTTGQKNIEWPEVEEGDRSLVIHPEDSI